MRNLRSSTRGEAYLQFARNTVGAMAKNFPAPLKCVDAVRRLDDDEFDAGMKYERETFTALMFTPECARCATPSWPSAPPARSPTPADTPVRPVKKSP